MSMQRKIKRAMEAQQRKEAGKRTTCRKCGARMVEKPGYGLVCMECGWAKPPVEEVKQ